MGDGVASRTLVTSETMYRSISGILSERKSSALDILLREGYNEVFMLAIFFLTVVQACYTSGLNVARVRPKKLSFGELIYSISSRLG